MRGIIWFKKDLRILDNPALFQACRQCSEGLVAIYLLDYQMWENHHIAHCQIEFIFRGLELLQSSLLKLGIPLLIVEIKKSSDIPERIAELCDQIKAQKLFFNHELELNESRRDQRVVDYLTKKAVSSEGFEDQFILDPAEFYLQEHKPFKVFTPFKNYWRKIYQDSPNKKPLAMPKLKSKISLSVTPFPKLFSQIKSGVDPKLWLAGELAAHKRLKKFIEQDLRSYDQKRDFPILAATSQLSPYLATGMISARSCFYAALEDNYFELDTGNPGALTWMSELIWRDFYRHVLRTEPRVCMNKAYKKETEKLPWSYDQKRLHAWQQGQTGFPIVDAAMRQLNRTGWMHNRLRMIVAMFLAKNLFLDWRLGEQYFCEHLIDLDFSSNNGGWQWSASTGTDAVPYFRIFNPTTQGQRFDPQGEFIRQFCPELSSLDNRSIHNPYQYAPELAKKLGYPKPIIDYVRSRQRCLEAFKRLK